MKMQTFLRGVLFVTVFSVLVFSEAFADDKYIVRRGDTLYSISKRTGVSIQALKEANALVKDSIKEDQLLTIPGEITDRSSTSKGSIYVVEKGDNLWVISKKVGMTVNEIKQLNHLKNSRLMPGQELVVLAPAAKEKENSFSNQASFAQDKNIASIPSEEAEEIEQETEGVIEEEGGEPGSRDLLGIWRGLEELDLFVKVVRSFEGTPYRYGGSSVRGTDCSGFVKKIYKIFGIELPRSSREQSKVGISVSKDELREGDLVFFRRGQTIGHVGIYIGNNEIVHASPTYKCVRLDSLDSSYFRKHFAKAVRIKEIETETTVTMNTPPSKDKL